MIFTIRYSLKTTHAVIFILRNIELSRLYTVNKLNTVIDGALLTVFIRIEAPGAKTKF